jgi:hypothetical protein
MIPDGIPPGDDHPGDENGGEEQPKPHTHLKESYDAFPFEHRSYDGGACTNWNTYGRKVDDEADECRKTLGTRTA